MLVCNAGLTAVEGKTKDGLDMVWGVNYLGHFKLLQVRLVQGALVGGCVRVCKACVAVCHVSCRSCCRCSSQRRGRGS